MSNSDKAGAVLLSVAIFFVLGMIVGALCADSAAREATNARWRSWLIEQGVMVWTIDPVTGERELKRVDQKEGGCQ